MRRSSERVQTDATGVRNADPKQFYEVKDVIASGALGKVVKVERKKSKESIEICAKIIDKEKAIAKASSSGENGLTREEVLEWLSEEIRILRKLKQSKFVVKFEEAFLWQGEYWIITELCTVGNLYDVLSRIRLVEADQRAVLYCTLEAVKYIQSCGFVHGDVKLENLLVDVSGAVKLCDFGGAAEFDKNGFASNRFPGTLPYIPPEILSGYVDKIWKYHAASIYHKSRDTWAIGVLALKLQDFDCRLDLVADVQGTTSVYRAICFGYTNDDPFSEEIVDYLSFYRPQDVSEEHRSFVKTALVVDYSKRPSVSTLLKHGFIRQETIKAKWKGLILDMLARFRVAPEPKEHKEFAVPLGLAAMEA